MSTHNRCFEQKYEKYQNFLSENFQFLVVKISVYLDRLIFVMFACVMVVSYVAFVLSLFVPYLSFLWKAVLCDRGLSWVSSLLFLNAL